MYYVIRDGFIMTVEIKAKAILLDMQEKLTALMTEIEKCNDLRESAAIYDKIAPIILNTADMLDELEKGEP